MRVVFERTGERRYAVHVQRGGEWLSMDPGPGFDPHMPHDLLHLIVESELGLTGGIFGQIERGGGAGTFRGNSAADLDKRKARRKRRRHARRDTQLQRTWHDQSMQSERATWICWQAWLAASADPELRARGQSMAIEVGHARRMLSEAERDALDPPTIERIRRRMDDLSGRWQQIAIGGRIGLSWPLERRSY